MEELEIWKDILSYEDVYEISNKGIVRRKKSKKEIKIDDNGVILSCKQNRKYYSIAFLMEQNFGIECEKEITVTNFCQKEATLFYIQNKAQCTAFIKKRIIDKDKDIAEDIFQEVFLGLMKYNIFNVSYMYGIAKNRIAEYFTKIYKQRKIQLFSNIDISGVEETYNFQIDNKDLFSEIENNEVLKMYNEGATTREIAKIVGFGRTKVSRIINEFIKLKKQDTQ